MYILWSLCSRRIIPARFYKHPKAGFAGLLFLPLAIQHSLHNDAVGVYAVADAGG